MLCEPQGGMHAAGRNSPFILGPLLKLLCVLSSMWPSARPQCLGANDGLPGVGTDASHAWE